MGRIRTGFFFICKGRVEKMEREREGGYAGRKTGSLKKKLKGTWRQPISLNSRKKSLGVGERGEKGERERERK